MKTSSLVDEIKRWDKHSGHSGGIDGCPLCSRKAEEDLLKQLGSEPQAEEQVDPVTKRISDILGEE